MKVFDGSQFARNPLLVSGGVQRKHMVYMDTFYPQPNPDYTVVNVAQCKQIGALLESMGVTDALSDIEYLPGAPESICWYMNDPTHRPTAIEMHKETAAAVRETYSGKYGFYLWADWADWACSVIRDGSYTTDYVVQKFDRAMQWELDLRAISPYVDVIYPSAYFGGFAEYAKPDGGSPWYGLPYGDYLEAFALCVAQHKYMVQSVHSGVPMQLYVTNNAEGARYPAGCWDDILRTCSNAGVDVVAWNAPAYQPSWSDFDCGLMVAHNG